MSRWKDIYEKVTDQIVAAIEKGQATCRMPWHSVNLCEEPVNVVSKKHYRGINVLSLWTSAQAHEYEYGLWGTYNQWQSVGAQVKKGESGTDIVFWKQIDARSSEGEVEPEEKSGMLVARGFTVFNVAQVDGYRPTEVPGLSEIEKVERAERFYSSVGAEVRHGGNKAYYNISEDRIILPPFEQFCSAVSYYATLGHEMTHWTGASSRLARDFGDSKRLDVRAVEELVAELGAAFLCARLELPAERRPDHAAYVQSWLNVLKSDNRAIFRAASSAQKAVDWLCGVSQALASAA